MADESKTKAGYAAEPFSIGRTLYNYGAPVELPYEDDADKASVDSLFEAGLLVPQEPGDKAETKIPEPKIGLPDYVRTAEETQKSTKKKR